MHMQREVSMHDDQYSLCSSSRSPNKAMHACRVAGRCVVVKVSVLMSTPVAYNVSPPIYSNDVASKYDEWQVGVRMHAHNTHV